MFTVVLFISKKVGVSPEEFKHHYEGVHVPLVRSLVGDLFPLTHIRRYLAAPNGTRPQTGFDTLTEMTFRDRESFETFSSKLMDGENGTKVVADCEEFLDASKTTMVVISEELKTVYNRRPSSES